MRSLVLPLPPDPEVLPEVVVEEIEAHPVHLVVHVPCETDRLPTVLVQVLAELPVQIIHRCQRIVPGPRRPGGDGPMMEPLFPFEECAGTMLAERSPVLLLFVRPQGDRGAGRIEQEGGEGGEEGGEAFREGGRMGAEEEVETGALAPLGRGHAALAAEGGVVERENELGCLTGEEGDVVGMELGDAESVLP